MKGKITLFFLATSLSAQFMSTRPFTGGGNNALKQLRPGSSLPAAYIWQPGVYQKDWASSTLAADVAAPRPRFPGTRYSDTCISEVEKAADWNEGF